MHSLLSARLLQERSAAAREAGAYQTNASESNARRGVPTPHIVTNQTRIRRGAYISELLFRLGHDANRVRISSWRYSGSRYVLELMVFHVTSFRNSEFSFIDVENFHSASLEKKH